MPLFHTSYIVLLFDRFNIEKFFSEESRKENACTVTTILYQTHTHIYYKMLQSLNKLYAFWCFTYLRIFYFYYTCKKSLTKCKNIGSYNSSTL